MEDDFLAPKGHLIHATTFSFSRIPIIPCLVAWNVYHSRDSTLWDRGSVTDPIICCSHGLFLSLAALSSSLLCLSRARANSLNSKAQKFCFHWYCNSQPLIVIAQNSQCSSLRSKAKMAAVARTPIILPSVGSVLDTSLFCAELNMVHLGKSCKGSFHGQTSGSEFRKQTHFTIPRGWPTSIISSLCWTGRDLMTQEYLHGSKPKMKILR